MLPTETRVGNPNLRSDECGSRIRLPTPAVHWGFIGNGKSRIVRTNRDPLGRETGFSYKCLRIVGRTMTTGVVVGKSSRGERGSLATRARHIEW